MVLYVCVCGCVSVGVCVCVHFCMHVYDCVSVCYAWSYEETQTCHCVNGANFNSTYYLVIYTV